MTTNTHPGPPKNRTATVADLMADLMADPMYQRTVRLGVSGLAALFEQDRVNAGGVPANPAAELPECDGFAGTGQRCASCRTHKRLHG